MRLLFVVVLQPKSILNLFCIHRSWRETYRPLIGRHLTIDNLLTKFRPFLFFFLKVRILLILCTIMNINYMCDYLPSKYSSQLIVIMEYLIFSSLRFFFFYHFYIYFIMNLDGRIDKSSVIYNKTSADVPNKTENKVFETFRFKSYICMFTQ